MVWEQNVTYFRPFLHAWDLDRRILHTQLSKPTLIPSSSDIDIMSRPVASYPDAQGNLWHQTEVHKGPVYQ